MIFNFIYSSEFEVGETPKSILLIPWNSELQLNTHIIFLNTDIFYLVTTYIDAS